jgi:hypothetical protein
MWVGGGGGGVGKGNRKKISIFVFFASREEFRDSFRQRKLIFFCVKNLQVDCNTHGAALQVVGRVHVVRLSLCKSRDPAHPPLLTD